MSLPLLAARATRRLQQRPKAVGIAAGVLALLVIAVVAALGALPATEQVVVDQEVTGAAADIPPAYLAAYQQAARSVQPVIPWEILAGVGKVATDHGRRSPYDGTDRATAPAATYPDVRPPIVAHPAGPVTPPGATLGAVQTVAAVLPPGATAPDGELATDVNNVPVFLAGERQVESGGNYQASSGGASGAYQYIDATWASEARAAGYATYATGPAAAAPPQVQDAVAAYNAEQFFAAFHSWWWAAEAWYDPLWAGDPAEQSSVPYPSAGNTLTMAGYAQKVYAAMAASTGTGAGAPSAASTGAAAGAAPGPTVSGTGPLLLTAAGLAPAPGADSQDIDAEADLLARASAPVEERTWEQMGLPSSIVERPLSDPDAQRFWSAVLAALPTAAGVGIGQVSGGPGTPPADSPPPSRAASGTDHRRPPSLWMPGPTPCSGSPPTCSPTWPCRSPPPTSPPSAPGRPAKGRRPGSTPSTPPSPSPAPPPTTPMAATRSRTIPTTAPGSRPRSRRWSRAGIRVLCMRAS